MDLSRPNNWRQRIGDRILHPVSCLSHPPAKIAGRAPFLRRRGQSSTMFHGNYGDIVGLPIGAGKPGYAVQDALIHVHCG